MKTINHYITESIRNFRDKTLFVEWATREEVTYGEFHEQLARVANLLRSEGVKERDVVTLISDNSLDLAIMFYGVIVYGAIAKPLNPRLTPLEMAKILNHSGSKLVFADREVVLPEFDGKCLPIAAYRHSETTGIEDVLNKDFDDETKAELIYTSGTTGVPKGVLLSHRNIIHNITAAIERLGLDSNHTKLCLLPLYHNFGFISDLTAGLLCGSKVVIMDGFDITKLASLEEALAEHEVNSFSAVPLMYELFVRFDCKINPPSMKFTISGAAPLKERVALSFQEKFGFPIIPAYGLTESTCFCTISPLDQIKYRSIGKPLGNEIRIVSDQHEELGPNEVGELVIKSASVMRDFHYRSTVSCFIDPENTWLETGDLGYYDNDGFLYINGRKKNMVIRGGEKVYLEDIDVCLTELAGVADSATVYFEEADVEKIACVVSLEPGSQLDEFTIMSHIKERMGQYKCPDSIIFQDRIPRTITSKVKMEEVRQIARSHAAAARA